jgi:hypothetical protein
MHVYLLTRLLGAHSDVTLVALPENGDAGLACTYVAFGWTDVDRCVAASTPLAHSTL